MIIKEIEKNKYITVSEIADIIGKSEITIYRHLDSLVKRGFVIRVGSRKNGYWQLIK